METYISFTMTSMLVGWFGVISVFLNPFYVLANTIELIHSAKLVGWRKVITGIIAALGIPIGLAFMALSARRH